MPVKKIALGLAAALALSLAPVATPTFADAATAKKFKNCTELNKTYKHGVAKKGAKDKVSGKAKPVTTFTVNNNVYTANKGLDRDKDGIACEKR